MIKCHTLAALAITAMLVTMPLAGQGTRENKNGMNATQDMKTKTGDTGKAALRYEVTVTAEGTRSEGLSGKLYIGTSLIPGEYYLVEAYGVRYRYTPYTAPWTWWGHKPETSDFVPLVEETAITDEETKTGWYRTPPAQKKANTLRTWVYLESDVGCFWVSPDKLQVFLHRS